MKKLLYALLLISSISFLTSCASIVGGSKYWAHVKVPDHPNAKITYKGTYEGAGDVRFKVKRSEANKFSVTINEEGCIEQTFNYSQRSIRGWALAGTIITWTGLIGGIPIPWGVGVDLASGALWRPSIKEKGISKEDRNNYNYNIDYTGCKKQIEVSTIDSNKSN